MENLNKKLSLIFLPLIWQFANLLVMELDFRQWRILGGGGGGPNTIVFFSKKMGKCDIILSRQ